LGKRKILITGASRGLGLAMAKKLAADYQLILHASRPESFTEGIPDSETLCADLSDSEQLKEFCKRLKKDHGDLYGIINNAGLTYDESLMYQSEKYIDMMLAVNLKAPVMICKAALKIFSRTNKGVIINVSSVVGETGSPFQAVYTATKAGLVALTKSLAKEVGQLYQEHNIRVLSISPGFIETAMTDKLPQEHKDKYLNMISAKRFGTAAEVANVVSFLMSDSASYVNGANIQINGGMV